MRLQGEIHFCLLFARRSGALEILKRGSLFWALPGRGPQSDLALNRRFLFSFLFCDILIRRYEIKYDKDDYVLRLKKASVNDEGTFTCVAENRVGKLEASASLIVRGREAEHPASPFLFVPNHQMP